MVEEPDIYINIDTQVSLVRFCISSAFVIFYHSYVRVDVLCNASRNHFCNFLS
jgi:hypothetical protein